MNPKDLFTGHQRKDFYLADDGAKTVSKILLNSSSPIFCASEKSMMKILLPTLVRNCNSVDKLMKRSGGIGSPAELIAESVVAQKHGHSNNRRPAFSNLLLIR